jgi:hypothetical protein
MQKRFADNFTEFWRDIKSYIAPKLTFLVWFWRNIESLITPKSIYGLLQQKILIKLTGNVPIRITATRKLNSLTLKSLISLTLPNGNRNSRIELG